MVYARRFLVNRAVFPISISAKKRALDACARHFGSQRGEREIKNEKKKKRTKRKGKIAIKNRREKKGSGKKKVYGNSIIPKIVFQQAFVSRADMNQLWISSEGKISSTPEPPRWIEDRFNVVNRGRWNGIKERLGLKRRFIICPFSSSLSVSLLFTVNAYFLSTRVSP